MQLEQLVVWCKNCSHPVEVSDPRQMPPWCKMCGADLKAGIDDVQRTSVEKVAAKPLIDPLFGPSFLPTATISKKVLICDGALYWIEPERFRQSHQQAHGSGFNWLAHFLQGWAVGLLLFGALRLVFLARGKPFLPHPILEAAIAFSIGELMMVFLPFLLHQQPRQITLNGSGLTLAKSLGPFSTQQFIEWTLIDELEYRENYELEGKRWRVLEIRGKREHVVLGLSEIVSKNQLLHTLRQYGRDVIGA